MSMQDNDGIDDGGGEFDDLPSLGSDGVGNDAQNLDPIEEGSKLDKLLDDHITQTGFDPRTPAQGAGQRQQGQDGRTQQPQGQQQQPRGQQRGTQDGTQTGNQRGQGDDRGAQHGTFTHQPRKFGSFFQSGQDGSLYDVNGRKIANVGLERRVAERIMGYYRGMETEYASLKQQLEGYSAANSAAKDAGLSIEEHAMGMRLMSAWKADPIKTINFLLTQAQNRNIDVSSIRQGSGFDPAAVGQLLEERLSKALERFNPLLEGLQQQRENAEIREQIQNEITAFFEEFPAAEMHRPVLGALMAKTGYNPREAWFALRAEAAASGWDLTKPLPEQARASYGNGTGNGAAPTGGGRTRVLPDMNGRGAGGGSRQARTVRAGSREVASTETSYDSIIQDALNEVGQQQQ